jgi:dTDP-4-amino-4,6-dideoxygalactose transaminase
MIPIAKPLLNDEEKQAIQSVVDSGIIAAGPKTEEFEKAFGEFVGTKYGIATTSGTTALHLGLLSLDIKKGDEVILPSFSFIASANVIRFCDATPVFCDVDLQTFNINHEQIEHLITEKTKAVMPVHLYGQAADMKPIEEIAEKHNISIIGDAAQAHGASYHGSKVGSFGDLECFSFYPTKNMTTGEGGMITTNDEQIVEKAQSIRNHGRNKTKWGYEHDRVGYNYRMTDIAASIGLIQLKKLPEFLKKRRKNASFFDQNLKGVTTPYQLPNAQHTYHQYTIQYNKRSELIEHLKKNQIGFGIYYPKPLHKYPHLKKYSHKDLKNSEILSENVLSLPIHPAVTTKNLEFISEQINEVCQHHDK